MPQKKCCCCLCVGSLVREPSGVIVYTYVYSSARSVRASLCARPALVEVLTSINRVFFAPLSDARKCKVCKAQRL